MKPDTYINEHLSVEDCHKLIKADVAWLRMVYRHLTHASVSLHDKTKTYQDRVDNTYSGLDNAITYKSVEDQEA